MTNKINISQEQSETYRLTPRGERVKKLATRAVQAVGIGVSGAVLTFVGNEMVAAQHAAPEGVDTYTIQPGDTLTDIAVEQVDDGAENVKDTIDTIQDMNEDIEPGNLQVGSSIKIPE